VAIHEPVIPVNERCWHTLKRDDEKERIVLEYYAGFGEKPYDSVDLSALLKP